MADDERIEQLARQKGFLNDEQVESVRQEIRDAADRGEQLSFLDAATRTNVLYTYQAEQLREEAEKEVSSAETQDISEAIPGQVSEAPIPSAAPSAEGGPAVSAGEGAAPGGDAAKFGADGTPVQPVAEAAGTVAAPAAADATATAGGAATLGGAATEAGPVVGPVGAESPAASAANGEAAAAQAPSESTPPPPTEAAQAQKPPYTALAVGAAILLILIILVAILNH